MSTRFVVASSGARLEGWVRGSGPPLLLLHGGPGLSFDYLDGLADQLDEYRVACYQQRGLAPSSSEGPFAVADHVADAVAVLDELGWGRALVVGHSWGGHLALHLAAAVGDRVLGVLAVDTLGAVGDGGGSGFEEELAHRTPEQDLARIAELDARVMRGEGTVDDEVESMRLIWPAYFATRDAAPPMPPISLAVECYVETCTSMSAAMPELEAALSGIQVPVGFLTGAKSPMPQTASTDTAARIPRAWVESVPDAGHFVWLDSPGSVLPSLGRLREDVDG